MKKSAKLDSQLYCAKTKKTTFNVLLREGKRAEFAMYSFTPIELYQNRTVMDLLSSKECMHVAYQAGMQQALEQAERILGLKRKDSRQNKGGTL